MCYEGMEMCDWLKKNLHNPVSDHVTETVCVIWLGVNTYAYIEIVLE